MIPYFEQPIWHLGALTIHAFGVTVAVAMWMGFRIIDQRIHLLSLDTSLAQRLCGWMVIGGVVGAHLFSVLLYFPEKVLTDPWLLLRIWENISSFGGMLGGIGGALLFFAFRAPDIGSTEKLAYLDVIAFAFPTALAIGRFGCALAHDHPGQITTFPLSISLSSSAALAYVVDIYGAAGLDLPSGASQRGFHDLGLDEFLFLTLIVVPLFRYWNRQRQPAGFFLLAFAALYLPVRFCLDTLRVADVRYGGLTPAQWVAAAIFSTLPFFAVRHRTLRFALAGAVILGAGWACAAGAR